MIHDNRFEFSRFDFPCWSELMGGKGARRGANGKFYLPPGSAPTAKMGVMGSSGDPDNPAKEPLGKVAKGAGGGDADEEVKTVKAEVVTDEKSMNLLESFEYQKEKLRELRERMEKTDRELARAVGEYYGATSQVIDNLANEATNGNKRFTPLNPATANLTRALPGTRRKSLEEEVGDMNLPQSLDYANKTLREMRKKMEDTDRRTFRAIGEYVDATNQTIANLAKEAGIPNPGLGGSGSKRKQVGGSKQKQIKGGS